MVCKILRGPIFKDDIIIASLAGLDKGVIGVQDAIKKAYQYSVPNLGTVAKIFNDKGYWAVVEIRPIPGIPVPPHKLYNRWKSPEEAWQRYRPLLCSTQV